MNDLQNLARVRDEELAGQASGAGARSLLASITAESVTETEPDSILGPALGGSVWDRARRRVSGRARLAVAAVAVAGLAAGAVIGPTVLGERGPATSYANAAIDIELRGDTYVATIKDPFADYARYTEGFKAVGLNVNLELIPASPTKVGKLTGWSMSGPLASNGRSIDEGTAPEGCVLGSEGCAMTVMVPRDWTGWAAIRLGREAKPGERYRNERSAMSKGEMLEGYRADEKTVGEVLAEVKRRGLKAVFQIITPQKDGYGVDPNTQSAPVPDDWMVWEVLSDQAGVVRLMVTKERLSKNPIYGGPRPADDND
ncbi:hypothetical protein ABZ897_14560 [Nonomuraea sp. NPDC046802]|uniref:hypothetical protein n=1 Tax=Nonomuraea sp. NPDC046802 TaxID=3154919 RepID=UPI0033CCAFB4